MEFNTFDVPVIHDIGGNYLVVEVSKSSREGATAAGDIHNATCRNHPLQNLQNLVVCVLARIFEEGFAVTHRTFPSFIQIAYCIPLYLH